MAKPPNDTVRVVETYDTLRIYIDNILHLNIQGFPAAVHTWIERGDKNFVIEYTLENGSTVTCEYCERQRFEDILEQLDKIL